MLSLDELFLEATSSGWCISLIEDYNSIRWDCHLSSKVEFGKHAYGKGITPNDALSNALHKPMALTEAFTQPVGGPSLDSVMHDFLILPKPKINPACVRRF